MPGIGLNYIKKSFIELNPDVCVIKLFSLKTSEAEFLVVSNPSMNEL
jgi:hypothetical protein